MNSGGDAAEQIIRMSLDGVEVAMKITGHAAKNMAILLLAILKEEGKTKGKARLTTMLKSGKELKVFSIQQKDLKKFTEEAKKYGVLYNVIRNKDNKSPGAEIDIIARAEDASKISRIVDKFKLATVDKAAVISEVERAVSERSEAAWELPAKDSSDLILEQALKAPMKKEENAPVNPQVARAEKSPPSEPNYKIEEPEMGTSKEGMIKPVDKPSVKEKLDRLKAEKKEHEVSEPSRDDRGTESSSKLKDNLSAAKKKPVKDSKSPKIKKEKVR